MVAQLGLIKSPLRRLKPQIDLAHERIVFQLPLLLHLPHLKMMAFKLIHDILLEPLVNLPDAFP